MEVSNVISQNTGYPLISHRSEFQCVVTEMRSNPVKFLEENLILNPQCYAHHGDTSFIKVDIIREEGVLRLKETEVDMANSDYILFTGIRDTDAPERFDAPAVISLSNQCLSIRRNDITQTVQQSSPLWLTNQQSGCSVLIVRHGLSESGGQQYSMIHMRPRDSENFIDEFTPALYANTQEILLERDIQSVLANTFPNENPEAFILVPSAENFIVEGCCTQLIGISNERGEFDFYRQIYPVIGGEYQVEALRWTRFTI